MKELLLKKAKLENELNEVNLKLIELIGKEGLINYKKQYILIRTNDLYIDFKIECKHEINEKYKDGIINYDIRTDTYIVRLFKHDGGYDHRYFDTLGKNKMEDVLKNIIDSM